VATRWASFDCYGTLIDWNAGIRTELARIFGEPDADRLLSRYHEHERRIQEDDPTRPYREVMAGVLAELARDERIELPPAEADALARSLPSWPAFDEVSDELRAARERGWRLAILSNTDRDLIEASMERIGVPFELAIVASEIGSYKPARGHWDAFTERASDRGPHVHVAASLYHDIAPAAELGIAAIWINRLGEESDLPRAVELPDLRGLADALDRVGPEQQRPDGGGGNERRAGDDPQSRCAGL
jgi:2-haloacid dehalogenase